MILTENSPASEICKQLRNTFDIHLSFGDLFNIRKAKIIKHLEKWKLEEPLEFRCFKSLKWESSISTSQTSILNVTFDNIKISFLRQCAQNNIVIWVNDTVTRELRIYENGQIHINDYIEKPMTEKVLDFLLKSHLVNKEFHFVDSIWL